MRQSLMYCVISSTCFLPLYRLLLFLVSVVIYASKHVVVVHIVVSSLIFNRARHTTHCQLCTAFVFIMHEQHEVVQGMFLRCFPFAKVHEEAKSTPIHGGSKQDLSL